MSTLANVLQFRLLRQPISGLWGIDDTQAYGCLAWEDDAPVLQITFEVKMNETGDGRDPDHPLLRFTKPPLQPSIEGQTSEFGHVTLENCFRHNVKSRDNYAAQATTYDLFLTPTRIWIGARKADVSDCIEFVSAQDTRLFGFFRTPGLVEHRRHSEENKTAFAVLGNPHSIWSLHPVAFPAIKLGSTGFELRVGSSVSESYSATEGSTIQSVLCIEFTPSKPTPLEECSSAVRKFEQIVTVFSLEYFRFQAISFHAPSGPGTLTLAWQIGEDRDLFKPPMRHQILVDLSDQSTLTKVCEGWFNTSHIVELSRWLFCRSLEETDDGLARFVGVSQALEVLGRELGPRQKMSKKDIEQAEHAIRAAFGSEFETEFIERTIGLMRSSNRASFRDVLRHMIEQVQASGKITFNIDAVAFSKKVSDIRNAVIHMTTINKGALDDAFGRVNKLSLLLCFWYVMIQAVLIDVEVADAVRFLLSNRNARHGLPNEVLEWF